MRQLTATAGLAFVLVTACIDTAEPPELTLTEELTATLRGDSVLLHNGSAERVHLALNGEEDPTAFCGSSAPAPIALDSKAARTTVCPSRRST